MTKIVFLFLYLIKFLKKTMSVQCFFEPKQSYTIQITNNTSEQIRNVPIVVFNKFEFEELKIEIDHVDFNYNSFIEKLTKTPIEIFCFLLVGLKKTSKKTQANETREINIIKTCYSSSISTPIRVPDNKEAFLYKSLSPIKLECFDPRKTEMFINYIKPKEELIIHLYT
jgi:hypothetical protein